MLRIEGHRAIVSRLYPMLEGQVAGLSSGLAGPADAIRILDALRNGPLYREDQHSYMLYPNRAIKGFFEKNQVDNTDVAKLAVAARPREEWSHILEQDVEGSWHFHGSFRNEADVRAACAQLSDSEMSELVDLFERTFDHRSFTGRSGTFFGYEGLGSVYWHMVSKLLLAVQDILVDAALAGESAETVRELKDRYLDVRRGLGFMKDPATYGAVPLDAYSHTPWGQGAKQPGMTGQVKEEIVARYAELGLVVRDATIRFLPALILDDQWRAETDDLAFTFCGVPVHVGRGGTAGILVAYADGTSRSGAVLELTEEESREVFLRSGKVTSLRVQTGTR